MNRYAFLPFLFHLFLSLPCSLIWMSLKGVHIERETQGDWFEFCNLRQELLDQMKYSNSAPFRVSPQMTSLGKGGFAKSDWVGAQLFSKLKVMSPI